MSDIIILDGDLQDWLGYAIGVLTGQEEDVKGGEGSGWFAPPKGTHGPGSQGGQVQMVLPGWPEGLVPLPGPEPSEDDEWNAHRRMLRGLRGTAPDPSKSREQRQKKDDYFNAEWVEPQEHWVEYEVKQFDLDVDPDRDALGEAEEAWASFDIGYHHPTTTEWHSVGEVVIEGDDAYRWWSYNTRPDIQFLKEEGHWQDHGLDEGEYILDTALAEVGWQNATEEMRGEMKATIVAALARRMTHRAGVTTEQAVVNEILRSWAKSSSKDADSLILQHMAAREFGLHREEWVEGALREWRNKQAQERTLPHINVTDEQARAFLQQTYRLTQSTLEARGFEPGDTVWLYRGFKLPIGEAREAGIGIDTVVNMIQNPLASWSASYEIAQGFSMPGPDETGVVVEMAVPVEHIVSSATTGLGCITEGEFVVLGFPAEVRVLDARERDSAAP